MFTLEEMNEIIKSALTDVASGMIKNASGFTGSELEKHLRDSFDMLVELGRSAKKIASEKFE